MEQDATSFGLEMKPGDTFGVMMFRNLDEGESRLVKILSLETIIRRPSLIQAHILQTLQKVTVYKTPEELRNSSCLKPGRVIITLGPPRRKEWYTEVLSTLSTVSFGNIWSDTLFGDLLAAWCRITRQDLQRRQVIYHGRILDEDLVVLDELSDYKHEQLGNFYFTIFPVHQSSQADHQADHQADEEEVIVEPPLEVEETRQEGKTGKKKRAKLRNKHNQILGVRQSGSESSEMKGEKLKKTGDSEGEVSETEEKSLTN